MNDNILRILTEHSDFIPLKKERVSPEEAYSDTDPAVLKPGYTRTFLNYEEKCLRYDCTDDDVTAAQLKLSFELLNTTKKIHLLRLKSIPSFFPERLSMKKDNIANITPIH